MPTIAISTDGPLTLYLDDVAFVDNVTPAGTASGILVATFGPPEMTVTSSILQGLDGAFACATEGGGAAVITSCGHDVISDGFCNPDGLTEQSSNDAMVGPLADNSGPTWTHALPAGSPPPRRRLRRGCLRGRPPLGTTPPRPVHRSGEAVVQPDARAPSTSPRP